MNFTSEIKGAGERGQKDKTGLLRSFHSLAMTGVNKDTDLVPYCLSALLPNKSEGKKTGCQEDKLFNESCHPEFISGSVHSEKWKLPWSKMLKRVQHDKFGFTLVEVLITIGIIGVVAAITIPGLVTNYKKKITVAKLKEDYSIFAQAMKKAVDDNGGTVNFTEFTDIQERNPFVFDNYVKPYLKISRVCPSPTLGSTDCWVQAKSLSNKSVNWNHGLTFELIDGQTVRMWAGKNHIQFKINVNGLKNDAVLGKDVFGFFIDSTGTVYLNGEQDIQSTELVKKLDTFKNGTNSGCNKEINTGTAGDYCGALIKYNNWKIPKDYPW